MKLKNILFLTFFMINIIIFIACSKNKNALNDNTNSTANTTVTPPESVSVLSEDFVTLSYSNNFRISPYANKRFNGSTLDSIWLTSLFVDNQQVLLRENIISDDSMSDMATTYNKYTKIAQSVISANTLNDIKAKDYYTEDSTNYNTLTDDHLIMQTTSSFNPIVSKVEYIDYTQSEKAPKSIWIDEFQSEIDKLGDFKIDTPAIISESWTFKYNNQDIEIVTATNVQYDKNNARTFYPEEFSKLNDVYSTLSDNQHIAYTFTLLFIDGKRDDTYSNWLQPTTSIMPFATSFFTSDDYYSLVNYGYSCYQYDEKGNIILLPVITFTAYDDFDIFRMLSSFMFADVDSDGKGEIIMWQDIGHISYPLTLDAYNLYANTSYPKMFCPELENGLL